MQGIRTAVEGIAESLRAPVIRAAIYCRISKDRHDEEKGVQRQEEDCRALAERLGYQVVAVFVDNDVSAYRGKVRPQYQAMLQAIRNGQVDVILAYKTARLYRRLKDLIELIDLFEEHGLKTIQTVRAGEIDLSTPAGRTQAVILARIDQQYSEDNGEQVRRQQLQAAIDGKFRGGGKRAFGYTGKRQVKNQQNGATEVQPIVSLARALFEQDCIREAIDRIIAGDSLRGICIDWNRRGIKTALDEQWQNTTLRRMLVSPRIAGYREHSGQLFEARELVDGEWLPAAPIVARDKWEACRMILTDPKRRTTLVGRQPKYLLAGLIYCSVCGRRLRARVKKGKHLQYYCRNDGRGIDEARRADSGNYHVYRDAARVEELITEALFRAVESQDAEDVAAGMRPEDPTKPHYEALAQLTALKDGLEDKFARDLIGEPAYKRNMAEFEREEEQHWAAISRLKDDRVRAHIPKNLRELWPDYSLDRRRAIIASVTEWIRIHPLPQARVSDAEFAEAIEWELKPGAWQ